MSLVVLAVVSLLASVSFSGRAQAQPASPFTSTAEARIQQLETTASGALSDTIANAAWLEWVEISPGLFREQLDAGAVLTLPSGRSFAFASLSSGVAVEGAQTWIGQLTEGGSASFVDVGGIFAGEVQTLTGPVHLTAVEGDSYILHTPSPQAFTDPVPPPAVAQRSVEFAPLPPGLDRYVEEYVVVEDSLFRKRHANELAARASAAGAVVRAQTTTTIDVMVWYDNKAVTYHGSAALAEAAIINAVASANAGFNVSGVLIELNLSELSHVNYNGSGDSLTDLNALRNKYDGLLDQAHPTRDATNSDLVSLITKFDPYANGSVPCGIGSLLREPPTAASDDVAFSAMDASCFTNQTFVHELGHNLGAMHDVINSNTQGAYPYSFGYVDPPNGFTTVMAYRNTFNGCVVGGVQLCTRINQFSSPTALYNGHATGSATLDNARTLNENRLGVAAYRPDPCPNPPNDDYAARVVLTGSPVSVVGANTCADRENLEVAWSSNLPNVQSVWYEWTAVRSGPTTASTCSPATDYDSHITVLPSAATVGALDYFQASANNDAGAACASGALQSIVSFTAVQGNTYVFRIDGTGTSEGAFELTIDNGTDTTPPQVTITSPTPGADLSGDITVTGTATDDTSVDRVTLVIKDKTNSMWWNGSGWSPTYIRVPAVLSGGTWSYTYSPPTGTAAAYTGARAYDQDDNVNSPPAVVNYSISSDLTAPIVTITEPSNGEDINGDVTVAGTIEDEAGGTGPDRVELVLKDKTNNTWFDGTNWVSSYTRVPATLTGTTWTYTYTPPATTTPIYTSAWGWDSNNNRTQPPPFINYTASSDVTPPVVTITQPSSGATINGDVTIDGTIEDGPAGSGPDRVELVIKDNDTNTWFDGTNWVSSYTRVPATLTGTTWTYTYTPPATPTNMYTSAWGWDSNNNRTQPPPFVTYIADAGAGD